MKPSETMVSRARRVEPSALLLVFVCLLLLLGLGLRLRLRPRPPLRLGLGLHLLQAMQAAILISLAPCTLRPSSQHFGRGR